MKSFPAAPPLFLIFILSVHLGAAIRAGDVAKFCCFQYGQKILPWRWGPYQSHDWVGAKQTPTVPGFTTKRGQKVCAKPNKTWVQRYVSLLRAQQQEQLLNFQPQMPGS
ncbi:c-C motif chemokine 26-like protein [Camelus ferus]|nr:c-C motif chemokine 26-like protein [Camelus ferus]